MKKIAIQGAEASFHDVAAKQFFGNDINVLPCDTFVDCFKLLKNEEVDHAVVAIENSLYGSINEVYDLLQKHRFWIAGEVYLRVAQCLIGLPGTKLEDIREVHSHPVALAQCEAYLDTKLPEAVRFEHHDTAGSVADVKKWGDPAKAAIASREAAQLYGLEVLAEEIETNKQNYTRFVVLSKQGSEPKGANKTSLIMVTAHAPGALYHALGAFANNDVNLTKLQSRPIIGQAWHYMFYVDVTAATNSPQWHKVSRELKDQGCEVTVLGTYKAGNNVVS
jgi:prephenate dehydratase